MAASVEPISSSETALPVCLCPRWEENPYRLVSLWDIMVQFELAHFQSVVSGARMIECACKELGLGAKVPDRIITLARVGVAQSAYTLASELKLTETASCAIRLDCLLAGPPIESSALLHNLRGLMGLAESEIEKRMFFSIPDGLAKYYKQEKPMGGKVFDEFPSSRFDITEAGTCLACANNVAAAFHLMRASEIGLWELGRDRQIPLAQSGKIEFSEWGNIIAELEIAVKAIQQWPNSKQKEDAHKFYNSAVVEIRAFNDGWRRHAAHVRPTQPVMHGDEAIALWATSHAFLEC